MKNPQELIGRKVRGFKFESVKDKCIFVKEISDYIGKKGVIRDYNELNKSFQVLFNNGCTWHYPADQIEAHLVDDEIPTLSDGVMMLVSDDEEDWKKRRVFGKKNSYYCYWYGNNVFMAKYAKPLEPTKEEQLTAILGSSEKVSEIMELFKK
jgi:hypothetical protein